MTPAQTHLKSAVEYAKKWPRWKKWTYGFIAFAIINAIVNPQPQATPEQKAAQAAQDATKEAAEKAERFQNSVAVVIF